MTTSSGTQNTQSQTVTQPWQPAQPALQSILGNVQGLQNQAGINPTEQAAIQQLQSNTSNLPNFAPTVANTAQAYLTGDPNGVLNPAYQNAQSNLGGIANPNNLNPFNTPGFGDALNTLNQDITQQVNGEFAAAGRSGSGYNNQTLARGLSQGEGQLLANQYNQNVQNLLGANSQLFGNATGLNSALGQNVSAGATLGAAQPGFATQGPSAQLAAGQAPFNLLAGNQGAISGLTVPIASLGGQSNTNATGSYSASNPFQAAQQVGSLFGTNGVSPYSGATAALGGILGGLGSIFG